MFGKQRNEMQTESLQSDFKEFQLTCLVFRIQFGTTSCQPTYNFTKLQPILKYAEYDE